MAADQTASNPRSGVYIKTGRVAELLHVTPKTVMRWSAEGKLSYMRTLGGHRLYPADEVRALARTLMFHPEGGDTDA